MNISYCRIHNKPAILFFSEEVEPQRRLPCIDCYNSIYQKGSCNFNQQQMNCVNEKIFQITQSMIDILEMQKNILLSKIEKLMKFLNEWNHSENNESTEFLTYTNKYFHNLQKSNQLKFLLEEYYSESKTESLDIFFKKLEQQIFLQQNIAGVGTSNDKQYNNSQLLTNNEIFPQYYQEENFFQNQPENLLLNQLDLDKVQESLVIKNNQNQIVHEQQNIIGKFEYQALPIFIKYIKKCRALVFNSNNTILFVAGHNQIKVFEFQNEQQLIEKCTLKDRSKKRIRSLVCMNGSDNFFTGGKDGKIIYWKYLRNFNWNNQQLPQTQTDKIHSLIINRTDNLLISGCWDGTVNFFQSYYSEGWQIRQTIKFQGRVHCLSMNDSQNQIICGSTKYVSVIQQNNTQWQIIQQIEMSYTATTLSYLEDFQFALQTMDESFVHFYYYDEQSKNFIKGKQIPLKNRIDLHQSFQLQYIKSKKLLLAKEQLSETSIRVIDDRKVIVQQIQFLSSQLIVRVSKNGNYIAVCDNEAKNIQIQKYKDNYIKIDQDKD